MHIRGIHPATLAYKFSANRQAMVWHQSAAVCAEPISAATKKLQSEQLYFGDFYKLLLETKLMIKFMSRNICSEDQANSLENREKILTTNEVILSAIYLDPRIRRILLQNPLQQAAAKNHLVGLMRQILNDPLHIYMTINYYVFLFIRRAQIMWNGFHQNLQRHRRFNRAIALNCHHRAHAHFKMNF